MPHPTDTTQPVNTEPVAAPSPEAIAAPSPSSAPAEPTSAEIASDAMADAFAAIGQGDESTTPAAKTEPVAAPAPESKLPAAKEEPAKQDEDAALIASMPQRTAERFEVFRNRAKAAETKLAEYEPRLQQYEQSHNILQRFEGMVQDAGLAADEVTNLFQMAKHFKSNTPEGHAKAIAYIDGLRNDLALRTGKALPGTDPLAAFPDLRQRVDSMEFSEDAALELAKHRTFAAQHERTQQSSQQQVQQVQQTNAAAAAAFQSLQKKSALPGFAEKAAYIQQYFQAPGNMEKFVDQYPPQLWEQAVNMMFDMYQPQAAAPASAPAPAPLRSAAIVSGARVSSGPVTAENSVANAMDALGL